MRIIIEIQKGKNKAGDPQTQIRLMIKHKPSLAENEHVVFEGGKIFDSDLNKDQIRHETGLMTDFLALHIRKIKIKF